MTDAPAPTHAPALGHEARVLVYLNDEDSVAVLRQALSDAGSAEIEFREGGASAALRDLGSEPSPQLLVVDVSGADDPAALVHQLAGMCEPSCSIVVVGEANDIRLYRELEDAGAREYFFKPLVTALVSREVHAALTGTAPAARFRRGHRVFVIGVRGGCGATTIAMRTAWRLAESPPRPVLALDLDLRSGDAALQLDAIPNHALTDGLTQPERVDDLFLERGVIHAGQHLDLFAALEPLDASGRFEDAALAALLDKVANRYRFIVADMPAHLAPDLATSLHLPGTLILVSDGRLSSAREVGRWRRWVGASTAERTVLHVLNMAGAPGSLPPEEFVRAAGAEPDIEIPHSREVAESSLVGLKAAPSIAAIDRALEPVIGILSGDARAHRRSLLERLTG